MSSTKWFPPTFSGLAEISPSNLDQAFQAIFTGYYALIRQAVLGVTATGVGIAWGVASVTGALTNIPTGLATVLAVVPAMRDLGAVAEFPSAAPSAAPGNIDINVTKAAGGASTTPRNIAWIAIGTVPTPPA